jgi:hypothetical protein
VVSRHLLTSAAAARYLDLAGRDSVRIGLAQRGIHPVGREPGPTGQISTPPGRCCRTKVEDGATTAYNRWRDAAGVIDPAGWLGVEQVLVGRLHGAGLPVGQTNTGIRQGNRLVVRFDGETQPINIRPDLVRLPGEHWADPRPAAAVPTKCHQIRSVC